MRIASYNIRKAVGLDGSRDPGRVVTVINDLGADIVVLQEVDQRLGNRPSTLPFDMIETHTDYQIANYATNDVSMGWHGNAILFKKSASLSETRRLSLPSFEPRGGVCARLTVGETPLTIVGVHLGLLRRWRRLQLQSIMRIPEIVEFANTLILGDFNEWSNRKGLEPIKQDLSILTPGHSFHAAWPFMSLDKIAYGSGIKIRNAGVEQSPLACIASDHLPIWADIELEPASAARACS